MCSFHYNFGAYIGKIVDRFDIKEDEQAVFESCSSDGVVDGDLLCSNINLGLDCQEIDT